jgi:chlorophyll synthase
MVYSLGGIAPAIVNDFKSIKGDAEFGIDSLPVMYGPDVAKWIAAAAQTLPELAVSLYLYSIGEGNYATALLALVLPQLYFIKTLLIADPIENDVKFQASCQPFFFLGLVLTSICMGNHDWSVPVTIAS